MYKRVDAKMFADKLMEMEDNTSVVFATVCENKMEIGETDGNEDVFHCFYYAKKVYEEQYNSGYIVIDYINGGEAHVIPLNWDKENSENFEYILECIQHYMSFWMPEIYMEVEE